MSGSPMASVNTLAHSPGTTRRGSLLCVVNGTTRGRHWSPVAAELRRTAAAAGVRRRFVPHQLR
jgi:hypothetical protein